MTCDAIDSIITVGLEQLIEEIKNSVNFHSSIDSALNSICSEIDRCETTCVDETRSLIDSKIKAILVNQKKWNKQLCLNMLELIYAYVKLIYEQRVDGHEPNLMKKSLDLKAIKSLSFVEKAFITSTAMFGGLKNCIVILRPRSGNNR